MKAKIRDLVAQYGGLSVDPATLSEDADLYEAGLASFASVQLMMGLEDAFGVEFPETMLNRGTFGSLRAIEAALVELGAERLAA